MVLNVADFNLHSSMDRFEVTSAKFNYQKVGDLHSSMDRFEGVSTTRSGIWLNNLHSSMDRFEAIGTIGKSCSVFIYIPVWIDLKSQTTYDKRRHNPFTFQYG